MLNGQVEELTPFFATGWAAGDDNGPAHVVAECNGKVLGAARADQWRADLSDANQPRAGFHIVFNSDVPSEALAAIRVSRSSGADTLGLAADSRIDGHKATQLFIVGSPRCGTSELAQVLAACLDLPWNGEGQPTLVQALATGAAALALPPELNGELAVAMAGEGLPMVIARAARRIYYRAHNSASFLDKTPGAEMIRATPFLHWCFPGARFIFMHRNGVANILSRLEKFGGDFTDHCRDWTACMETWEATRADLPDFLEIAQEKMASQPDHVAESIAEFLGAPASAPAITAMLRTGFRERTGAGLGKTRLADTDWSDFEITQFRTYCADAMARWGYSFD